MFAWQLLPTRYFVITRREGYSGLKSLQEVASQHGPFEYYLRQKHQSSHVHRALCPGPRRTRGNVTNKVSLPKAGISFKEFRLRPRLVAVMFMDGAGVIEISPS